MRFYDGHAKMSPGEVQALIVTSAIAIVFAFLTLGISILFLILASRYYYRTEKRMEELMRERAEQFRQRMDDELVRLSPLRTYHDYLPKTNRQAFEEPIQALARDISKQPEKYSDLWAPIVEEGYNCVRFLTDYNQMYFEAEKARHEDFFNGMALGDGYPFNEEQIEAMLTNDYSNLIVAGPGAGKTRVLTSRVTFFVNRKAVPPERVLVLAYSKSAAEEVRTRLKKYGIGNVDVSTFHSLGFSILRKSGQIRSRNAVEGNSDKTKSEIIDKLIEGDAGFRSMYDWYLSIWSRGEKRASRDSRHVDEQLREKMRQSYNAIDGTPVKSLAERDIANFFTRHGIRYLYEQQVGWCDKDAEEPEKTYCPDFYLPEYDVYIEHWSVNDNEETPSFYTDEETERYLGDMNWKRSQFKKHGKTLWETNHTLYVKGLLESELRTRLSEIGVEPTPVAYNTLLDSAGLNKNGAGVVSESIRGAVTAAKIYGLTPASLAEKARDQDAKSPHASREAEFILDLVLPVFERYEECLHADNKIDFEDMINTAVAVLEEQLAGTGSSVIRSYDLIHVDEFQDISYQRLRLLEHLQRLKPGCRLFCVGDDWQAIYGFAGSSALYMIQFGNHFTSPARVDLVQNYRNPRDILDFASLVIAKCKEKLEKKLKPRKVQESESATSPLVFQRIEARDEFDFREKQNRAVIRHIGELIQVGVKPSEILVLSRFNFGYTDLKEACEKASDIPVEFRKEGSVVREGVRFMSIHRSKGLEADHVLLLNVFEGLYGLPPEFSKDLELHIINPELTDRLDEERRLLFVAATRAKKQCTVFTMTHRESSFLRDSKIYHRHFSGRIGSTFRGRIIQESAEAYRIEAHLSPSWKPVFWAPKSQTQVSSTTDESGLQQFELTEWWLRKKREEGTEEGF